MRWGGGGGGGGGGFKQFHSRKENAFENAGGGGGVACETIVKMAAAAEGNTPVTHLFCRFPFDVCPHTFFVTFDSF